MSERHSKEAKAGLSHGQTCAQLKFEQKRKEPGSIDSEQVAKCNTSAQWDVLHSAPRTAQITEGVWIRRPRHLPASTSEGLGLSV